MTLSSPELLRNIKRRPPKTSVDYAPFWKEEKKKCIEGVTINGFHLSGWLYWHTNLWTIMSDYEDPVFGPIKKELVADLRDDDFSFDEASTRAMKERKGVTVLGRRNIGKSYWQASKAGYAMTFIKGSENICSAGNEPDLKRITTKIDLGLRKVPEAFYFDRNFDDWSKFVELGHKDKSGKREPWSSLQMINLRDGTNTEGFAGSRLKVLIIDEIGKFPVMRAYLAAKASFNTAYGWMCVPYLMGTGGDFTNGTDAWEIFSNPDAYNMISVEEESTGKVYGLYFGGEGRAETKIKTTVADHFKLSDGGIWTKVDYYQSDPVAGREYCLKERDQAAKSTEDDALLKEMMYYPLEKEEILLQANQNDFPIAALRAHYNYLIQNPVGVAIRLERKISGEVTYRLAERHDGPVTEWPVKKNTRKDAPVMMYEPPMELKDNQLYIAGSDPYNQSSSIYSSSLGTLYIYKRMYDLINGTFQDQMVASYAARPDKIDNWHETVEMLLEMYNAVCMPENEAGTFIQYFDQKFKSYMLADGMDFLKEIHPDTKIQNRNKGLPATIPVISYGMSLFKRYLTEDIQVGTDPVTKNPIMAMGLIRLHDPMLVLEAINYTSDQKMKGKFDRVVGFRHALMYAESLKKFSPMAEQKPPEDEDNRVIRQIGPFTMGHKSSVSGTPFMGTHRFR